MTFAIISSYAHSYSSKYYSGSDKKIFVKS